MSQFKCTDNFNVAVSSVIVRSDSSFKGDVEKIEDLQHLVGYNGDHVNVFETNSIWEYVDNKWFNTGKNILINPLIVKHSEIVQSVGENTNKIISQKGVTDALTLKFNVSDAGTSATKNVGTNANQIPLLDENGHLPESTIPAIALIDTFVVASQADMLALNAEKGDIAIRTDLNRSFILQATPASTLVNWKELLTPTDNVLSVNGKTGAVILYGNDIRMTLDGDTIFDVFNANIISFDNKLTFKADKTELIQPFENATLSVINDSFEVNCNDNTHYILNNMQDINLSIINAYNGKHFLIELHGGYKLNLPTNCKTDISFDYTVVGDGEYYQYEFLYDGNIWRVTRNVYSE